MTTAVRPAPGEYAPYYARYIDLVPDGPVVEALRRQITETQTLLRGLSAEQAAFRDAPGKWSVTEVVGHLADAERIFAYRALRFARGDATHLPGFDESAYAAQAGFGARLLAEVLAELVAVRAATVALYSGFDEAALGRRGIANDVPVSVRAIAWIIAGHEIHHRTILRERYLAAAP
jgi:uncharacterized damage-inducible protein DinB